MNKRVFIFCAWIVTLIATWFLADFELNKGFNRRIELAESMAFDHGVLKGKYPIDHIPSVKNSLLATDSLGFNITDTYFAKGTVLYQRLIDVTKSEGLDHNYNWNSAQIGISIDGNQQYVVARLFMFRDAFLNVCYNFLPYTKDVYVRDFIMCYSNQKYFYGETKYEDVAKWFEEELKTLCTKIKIKNEEIKKEIIKTESQYKDGEK